MWAAIGRDELAHPSVRSEHHSLSANRQNWKLKIVLTEEIGGAKDTNETVQSDLNML